MKEFDWVEMIFRWFIIVMGIIAIIMLLQKIFGYSPTSNEVMMSFIGILIGLVINLYYKFGRVDEFINVSKRTFLRIGADVQDIRKDITEIRIDITGIKKDVGNVKKDISILRKAVT